jgi:hypothetical protein
MVLSMLAWLPESSFRWKGDPQDLFYHFEKDFTWVVTGTLFVAWVDRHHSQASKQKVWSRKISEPLPQLILRMVLMLLLSYMGEVT